MFDSVFAQFIVDFAISDCLLFVSLQQVVPNFVIGCSLIGCTSSSLIG
ncbi:hypothetical protein T03_5442 [Trichinella britovi]|uniref:Uncharacterized protein n=1 Tax=Trichinella britovi TaxID=45882 RepID=A0A0V0ZMB8_TRIBR|nr:hypothetical protein T03_5442 [Trichinella britovi]